MRVPGFDCSGWDRIAAVLEVSPDTARRWARREHDPLPVRRTKMGHVIASSVRLSEWLTRQHVPA